jgi:uncharacterized membrane protein YcfT
MTIAAQQQPGRIDWVDYAKGICIVFVVMMHSTLGVEAAANAAQTEILWNIMGMNPPARLELLPG